MLFSHSSVYAHLKSDSILSVSVFYIFLFYPRCVICSWSTGFPSWWCLHLEFFTQPCWPLTQLMWTDWPTSCTGGDSSSDKHSLSVLVAKHLQLGQISKNQIHLSLQHVPPLKGCAVIHIKLCGWNETLQGHFSVAKEFTGRNQIKFFLSSKLEGCLVVRGVEEPC